MITINGEIEYAGMPKQDIPRDQKGVYYYFKRSDIIHQVNIVIYEDDQESIEQGLDEISNLAHLYPLLFNKRRPATGGTLTVCVNGALEKKYNIESINSITEIKEDIEVYIGKYQVENSVYMSMCKNAEVLKQKFYNPKLLAGVGVSLMSAYALYQGRTVKEGLEGVATMFEGALNSLVSTVRNKLSMNG